MVRVISEKLFSPPRSRHSSGETVDKELAARAKQALSSLNSRLFEALDFESSNDSHWDSELDHDGDSPEAGASESHGIGEESVGERDVLQKRRERRRERNKLSAQAYRIRRRQESVKKQNVMRELQEKNARLKSQVSSLEDQIRRLRHNAVTQRIPTIAATTTTAVVVAGPTIPPAAPLTGPASPGGRAASLPPPAEEEEEEEEEGGWEEGGGVGGPRPRHQRPRQVVDNDTCRRRWRTQVVDNFSFSRVPCPRAVPAPSPSPSPSQHPLPPSVSKPCSAAVPKTCLTAAEVVAGPGFQSGPVRRCPPADLNANSALATTTTTTTTTAAAAAATAATTATSSSSNNANINSLRALGRCQEDNLNINNNNNNNNVLLAMPASGGARPKVLLPPGVVFQFSKV